MKLATPFILFGFLAALSEGSSHSDTVFNIHGAPSYFAGTNTWWLSYLASDNDLEHAMSQISSTGLPVTRVWGFGNVNNASEQSIYFQLLDTATRQVSINNGANGITRLDAVVRAAEKYGIQLVLPLLNNWDDLGGINTYCDYFGCNATTFWANTGAQAAYQIYISFMRTRNTDQLGEGYVGIHQISGPYTEAWQAGCARGIYGVQNTQANRTAIMENWQATILASNIAYDGFWQFATNFSDGTDPFDNYAIYYGTQEYDNIVKKHVAAMKAKQVNGIY